MCLEASDVLGWWNADPLALSLVGATSVLYAAGVRRLWRAEGAGAGIRKREAGAYAAGQVTLLLALVSPIDRLSDLLFSAHMTQHEILMVVSPPLVVLGRPLVAFLWACPRRVRLVEGRLASRASSSRVFAFAIAPVSALLVHAVVVWLWHVPILFEAALRDEAVHAVQHAMLFGSAALFWWAIVRGRYGRAGYGLAALFVFATALHTSVLGVLLAVGETLWYPLYAERALSVEVDALGDQQLAGLVMWIPAGTLLGLVALGLVAAWLGEADRRHRAGALKRRIARS